MMGLLIRVCSGISEMQHRRAEIRIFVASLLPVFPQIKWIPAIVKLHLSDAHESQRVVYLLFLYAGQ